MPGSLPRLEKRRECNSLLRILSLDRVVTI